MSELDIPLGVEWRSRLDEALTNARIGIVVQTVESVRSPWLVYEAGHMEGRGIRVIPVRVNLSNVLMPRDYPLANQYVENNRRGIWALVQAINDCATQKGDAKQLEKKFGEAWAKYSENIIDPTSVLRNGNPEAPEFCESVFLGIAEETITANARSLILFAECSRIITRTDWFAGFNFRCKDPLTEQQLKLCRERVHETGERLAKELESLQCTVNASMLEEGAFGTFVARQLIEMLVSICDKIHQQMRFILDKTKDCHNEDSSLERLQKIVELMNRFDKVRQALTPHDSASPNQLGTEDDLTEILRAWQENLTAQSELSDVG